ncbi:hypothetical protein CDAR_573451 [Caerostris darwini]|uniref:Secreted protein n=1 Tax=Caerostris darwini TaxID=1538125 RepID=A0AAV4VNV6_9ARAC|nr:hypothetical protein CDAR_573451 [Caerostris darwini]
MFWGQIAFAFFFARPLYAWHLLVGHIITHREYNGAPIRGNPIDIFGGYPRFCSVFGGYPRFCSVFGGYPRFCSVFGGYPRFCSVFGGYPRFCSVFGGYPQFYLATTAIYRTSLGVVLDDMHQKHAKN